MFDDLTDDEDVVVVVEVEHSEEEEDLPPVHRLNYERRMSRRNAKHNAQKAIREANTRMTMYPNAEMDVKKRLSAQKQRRIEHGKFNATCKARFTNFATFQLGSWHSSLMQTI